MRCPFCRQGDLHAGASDEILSCEGLTLVVQGVPAVICDSCREPYCDEYATQRLLDLAHDAAAEGAVIRIQRYLAT